MTDRLDQRVREEHGQTLVLFVVLLTGLVVLLAFVVDVGAWLGTELRVESVPVSSSLSESTSGPASARSTGCRASPMPPRSRPSSKDRLALRSMMAGRRWCT